MTNYQIITDAACDGFELLLENLPACIVIPMEVTIGDTLYLYGSDGNISTAAFYDMQRRGSFAKTSHINPATYVKYFEPILQHGQDILYIGLTSGLSNTMQSAELAKQQLLEQYPERTIICFDSFCASVGHGFIVREALTRQAQGMPLDELVKWLTAHRMQICHWFTVDTLEHLKHGGRISGTSAALGSVLNIKPMLHLNLKGQLEVTDKLRGRKKAIEAKVKCIAEGWNPELGNLVVIGHGDCRDEALQIQQMIANCCPGADIYIADIGPIIGAHTGPGMLAVIYWGNNR